MVIHIIALSLLDCNNNNNYFCYKNNNVFWNKMSVAGLAC